MLSVNLKNTTHRAIGTVTVPHIKGCLVRVPNARGLIRQHGIQKAMELYPKLQQAPVKEVLITITTMIDRRRYTGAMLRELRSRYGVGKRPHNTGGWNG